MKENRAQQNTRLHVAKIYRERWTADFQAMVLQPYLTSTVTYIKAQLLQGLGYYTFSGRRHLHIENTETWEDSREEEKKLDKPAETKKPRRSKHIMKGEVYIVNIPSAGVKEKYRNC